MARARSRSLAVTPPSLWVDRVTRTLSYRMSTSGWWFAASAGNDSRTTKATAPGKPPSSYCLEMAPSTASQPGRASRPSRISSSESVAMGSVLLRLRGGGGHEQFLVDHGLLGPREGGEQARHGRGGRHQQPAGDVDAPALTDDAEGQGEGQEGSPGEGAHARGDAGTHVGGDRVVQCPG